MIMLFINAGKPKRMYTREGDLPSYDEVNNRDKYPLVYEIKLLDLLNIRKGEQLSLEIKKGLEKTLGIEENLFQDAAFASKLLPITQVWRNNIYLKDYLTIIESLDRESMIYIVAYLDIDAKKLYVCGLGDRDAVLFHLELYKAAGEEELDENGNIITNNQEADDKINSTPFVAKTVHDFPTEAALFKSERIIPLSVWSGGVGFTGAKEQDLGELVTQLGNVYNMNQKNHRIINDKNKEKDTNITNDNRDNEEENEEDEEAEDDDEVTGWDENGKEENSTISLKYNTLAEETKREKQDISFQKKIKIVQTQEKISEYNKNLEDNSHFRKGKKQILKEKYREFKHVRINKTKLFKESLKALRKLLERGSSK